MKLATTILLSAYFISAVSSCKTNQRANLKDAVDIKNPNFGGGRLLAFENENNSFSRINKRNCFNPASRAEGSEQAEASKALITTDINRLDIKTTMISRAQKQSRDGSAEATVTANITEGLLKSLGIQADFLATLKQVTEQNTRNQLDTYVMTVRSVSHAVTFQPEPTDFQPIFYKIGDDQVATGWLTKSEWNNSLVKNSFVNVCGNEFLAMKEFGGQLDLAFGANTSSGSARSNSEIGGKLGGKTGEAIGISGSVESSASLKSWMADFNEFTNFAMFNTLLKRPSDNNSSCTPKRRPIAEGEEHKSYSGPFVPQNKEELADFIFCFQNWIGKPVEISHHFTDYSNVLPLEALDTKDFTTYKSEYDSLIQKQAKQLMTQELKAKEEEARVAKQAAVAPLKTQSFNLPSNLKPSSSKTITGNTREVRLQKIKAYIQQNMVFATPSECTFAGCNGYKDQAGVCTRCESPAQGVALKYGRGFNFCQNDTDCIENTFCRSAGENNLGICVQ
jgi:hypothetical protein